MRFENVIHYINISVNYRIINI